MRLFRFMASSSSSGCAAGARSRPSSISVISSSRCKKAAGSLPMMGGIFGLVVDDKESVRAALAAAGVKPLPGRFLDFLDPWGNRIEIVGYDNIQFTKAQHVLRGMGLSHLSKSKQALNELKDKGMAPT
jgi:hypothetical protein